MVHYNPSVKFRRRAYFLDFLLALQAALASFFNAAFLVAHGIPERYIGLVYAVAFALGIIGLLYTPRLLHKVGNNRLFVFASLLSSLLAVVLSQLNSPLAIIVTFIVISTVLIVIRFALDIFLEHSTVNESTGSTRAVFLTISNSAFIVAPLLGGFLAGADHFAYLYEAVAAILFALTIGSFFAFRGFKDPIYEKIAWRSVFSRIHRNPDFKWIFVVEFFLMFSYAVEAIYLPVHMHTHLQMSLSEIGVVFAISLIPFPLLQYPLGILGDTRWGEKEMLTLGTAIIAAGLVMLSFITTGDPAVWAIILFLTAIGAAMVEVSTESYFFKHVDGRSIGLVSAFRMLVPAAYIAAPVFGTIMLGYMPIPNIFALFGFVIALGIPAALMLKDTR